MEHDPRLDLDMTLDGEFRKPPRVPVSTRIIAGAVLVAVIAGGLAFAALALWVALAMIPVLLIAVVVAVATIRFKIWRARRGVSSGYVVRRS
jgi:hypothetical protein